MPTYEYYCERNGRTVEVHHKMAERLATWGELCARAGIEASGTPAATPVQRLISGAAVHGAKGEAMPFPACEAGPACCGGVCRNDA